MRLVPFFAAAALAASAQAPQVTPRRLVRAEVDVLEKSAKIALLVAVGDYDQQSSGLAPLKYPVADADGVGRILKREGYSVRTLYDRAATTGAIRQNIRELARQVQAGQGTFLFMFSGHGGRANQQNYLATFGTSVDTLATQGLSLPDLESLLNATGAKQRIAFIDACRSDVGGKGTPVLPPMRDTTASEGLHILFSTAQGALSYEDSSLQHGIFSHFLILGLSGRAKNDADNLITFSDLANYVTKQMRDYGIAHSGEVQVPYELGESSGDFLIAQYDSALVLPDTTDRGSQPPVRPMNAAPSGPMKLSQLTANLTFQPEGGAPSAMAALKLTANGGTAKTFTATLVGTVGGTFVDGTVSSDGYTFTFTAVQKSTAPVMLPGGYYTVVAGSLKLVLTPNSNNVAAGTIAGAMNLAAAPYQNGRPRPGSATPTSTTPVTVTGQLTGAYFAIMVPDTPGDNGTGGITAPPIQVPPTVPVAQAPADKCDPSCSAKIGSFKVAATYNYTHPTYGTLQCVEKAFQLPADWPGKPFLHAIVCKGLNANRSPVTLINFNLAATDRVHDRDAVILYENGIGTGSIGNYLEGRTWHGPWRVKIFGETEVVEQMTMEVTLSSNRR